MGLRITLTAVLYETRQLDPIHHVVSPQSGLLGLIMYIDVHWCQCSPRSRSWIIICCSLRLACLSPRLPAVLNTYPFILARASFRCLQWLGRGGE